MLQIQNIRLAYRHDGKALRLSAAKALHIRPEEIRELKIARRSYDCRRKPDIFAVYTLLVSCENEGRILKKIRHLPDVSEYREKVFTLQPTGKCALKNRPVIIGSGPAGLFCALELARAGYCPVIAERGRPVGERTEDVKRFWKNGTLNPESNIQFGEGGAGAFSDGKLSTGVRDRDGRCRKVLREFVRFGADEEILSDAMPHIGTDVLVRILVNMRREIENLGGTFLFSTRLDDITPGEGQMLCLHFSDGSRYQTQVCVLAIGNGAADTFRMLYDRKIPMENKAFAVGLRVEHTQAFIDGNAYGTEAGRGLLPAASYKLTAHAADRGIYSFCMCPGGYVVNSSSASGRTVVNGMSYHNRAGDNANAAIVMTVSEKDFGSAHPLAGLAYQKKLEENAYALCGGAIPQQRLGDFREGRCSTGYGSVVSAARGKCAFADLSGLFDTRMKEAFLDAFAQFEEKIPGFYDPDAVLSGIESRTSSPVRILRGGEGTSAVRQLYPCGEGAGYAGGICSAAMDGLKTAQQIASRYRPLREENGFG